MLLNKPTPPPEHQRWILPLYGLVLVGLLFGWWLLPTGMSPIKAQGTAVITKFNTAVLNNPVYVLLRPRDPVRLTNQVTAIATDQMAPAAPILLRASDQQVGQIITLEWALALGEAYTGYNVYRAQTVEAEGKLLVADYADVTYPDTTAETGTTYFYSVEGVVSGSAGKSVSQRSQVVTGTATDSTPPHAPTEVRAVNTQDGLSITLTWVNPTDADFAGVRMYRSTVFGTLGELVVDAVQGETYTDTAVPQNNLSVYYTLTSVDVIGNESPSTLRTAPPGNPNPFQVLYQ